MSPSQQVCSLAHHRSRSLIGSCNRSQTLVVVVVVVVAKRLKYRGPNLHAKSRNTNKHRVYANFFDFCLLPCDTTQELNGNCSGKLAQMNFLFWVDFCGCVFLLGNKEAMAPLFKVMRMGLRSLETPCFCRAKPSHNLTFKLLKYHPGRNYYKKIP